MTTCPITGCGTGTDIIQLPGFGDPNDPNYRPEVPPPTVIDPTSEYLMDKLVGQIELSQLATSLRSRINLIEGIQNGLTNLSSTVMNDNSILSQTLLALKNDLKNTLAYVSTQITITQSDAELLASRVDQIAVRWNDAMAAIQQEAFIRASETGDLYAQYSLKIDAGGVVSGFGLSSELRKGGSGAYSHFRVAADTFSIGAATIHSPTPPPVTYKGAVWADTSADPANPTIRWLNADNGSWVGYPVSTKGAFIVQNTPQMIDGVYVPAGVYIENAYIKNATIGTTQLAANSVSNLSFTEFNWGPAAYTSHENVRIFDWAVSAPEGVGSTKLVLLVSVSATYVGFGRAPTEIEVLVNGSLKGTSNLSGGSAAVMAGISYVSGGNYTISVNVRATGPDNSEPPQTTYLVGKVAVTVLGVLR